MARRPDITNFAKSLLGDVQRSRRRREKDDTKDILKAFLLRAGIGIANNVFARKAQDFRRNEGFMAAKLKYKNAVTDAEVVAGTQKSIEASGTSASEYFAEQHRPIITQGFQEAYPEEDLDSDAYNTWITSKSREFGNTQAMKHSESLAAARSLGSIEDYEAILQLKSQRPTTVGDAAVSRVVNFFRGKSQEEIDREVIESLKTDPSMQNVDKFNKLKSVYDKTKNLSTAYDYADLIFPKEKKVVTKGIKTTTIMTPNGPVIISFPTETDQDGNEVAFPSQEEHQLINIGDLSDNDADRIKTLNASFNFAKDVDTLLTQTAKGEFYQDLEDLGIFASNITSTADYTTASALLFSSTYAADPTKVRDKPLENQVISLLSSSVAGLQKFNTMIGSIRWAKMTPEEKDEFTSQVLGDFLRAMTAVRNPPRSGDVQFTR